MAETTDWKQLRNVYLSERIQDQINWYSKKSTANKTGYKACRMTIIVCGALIPLLVGYAEGNLVWLKYVAGFFGVLVAVSEGIMSLKKYRENWDTYRITVEALNRERLLYENRVGTDYSAGDEAAFKQFVQRAEQIMANENQEWKTRLEMQDKG